MDYSTSYCFKSIDRILRELQTVITNPAILEHYSSGVDPIAWVKYYKKWLDNYSGTNIFDKIGTDGFNFSLYDHDGNGIPDWYTLDDPRLILVDDHIYQKKYYVFYKDCDKIIYIDGTVDENGLPRYFTSNYNPSQVIRDIIFLQDIDLATDIHKEYKDKLYNTCWDKLDMDVKLLRKNDLVYFPNDPAKALIMNKAILDLNNPLKNPLILPSFDSGIDPFGDNFYQSSMSVTNPNALAKVVVPATMNETIYDMLMKEYAEVNDDPFYPTFLQNSDTTSGIFDTEDGLTGDFFLDSEVIKEQLDNGGIVPINTTEAPVLVFQKDDATITYYDPDTGEIVRNEYDWGSVVTNIAILEANGFTSTDYDIMKTTLYEEKIKYFDESLVNLSDIGTTITDVKNSLTNFLDYLDSETCFNLSSMFNLSSIDDLLKFIDAAACILRNSQEIVNALRDLAITQKLLMGMIASGVSLLGLGDSLDMLSTSLYPTNDTVKCLLAKTLLDDKLRGKYATINSMIAAGKSDLNDYINEFNRIRGNIVGEGMKNCLGTYYPGVI